jgi:hypothetical protein
MIEPDRTASAQALIKATIRLAGEKIPLMMRVAPRAALSSSGTIIRRTIVSIT